MIQFRLFKNCTDFNTILNFDFNIIISTQRNIFNQKQYFTQNKRMNGYSLIAIQLFGEFVNGKNKRKFCFGFSPCCFPDSSHASSIIRFHQLNNKHDEPFGQPPGYGLLSFLCSSACGLLLQITQQLV